MSERERFRRWAIIVPILAAALTGEFVWGVLTHPAGLSALGAFAIGVLVGALDMLGLFYFWIWRGHIR